MRHTDYRDLALPQPGEQRLYRLVQNQEGLRLHWRWSVRRYPLTHAGRRMFQLPSRLGDSRESATDSYVQ